MVYYSTNTGAPATNTAIAKWMNPFWISQSTVHDWGTAFINAEVLNGLKNWESTYNPEQRNRLALMPKLKRRINTLPDIGENS